MSCPVVLLLRSSKKVVLLSFPKRSHSTVEAYSEEATVVRVKSNLAVGALACLSLPEESRHLEGTNVELTPGLVQLADLHPVVCGPIHPTLAGGALAGRLQVSSEPFVS